MVRNDNNDILLTSRGRFFGFGITVLGPITAVIIYLFTTDLVPLIIVGVVILALGVYFLLKPPENLVFMKEGIHLVDKEGKSLKHYPAADVQSMSVKAYYTNQQLTGYSFHIKTSNGKFAIRVGHYFGSLEEQEMAKQLIAIYVSSVYGGNLE